MIALADWMHRFGADRDSVDCSTTTLGQPERSADYWDTTGFTAVAHAQRFLPVHGIVLNLFRIGRYVFRVVKHHLLRARAFGAWREATCA